MMLDLVGLLLDHAVHAVGIEGSAQLLSIGGRDGGDEGGGQDGALHQVDVAVGGQHTLVEVAAVQTDDIGEHLVAVAALILDIVDGEDAAGAVQLRNTVLILQQVDGHQSGLPVVAVDDIGSPVDLAGSLDDGAGEESVALAVIEVTVELETLEVVLVVHEVEGHTLALQTEQAAVGLAPAQSDVEVLDELHLAAPLLADALVQGQHDDDFVAFLSQSLRQRAGHVGQTAGLDKRSDLRSGKQNFHLLNPPNELHDAALGDGQRIVEVAHQRAVLVDDHVLVGDDKVQGGAGLDGGTLHQDGVGNLGTLLKNTFDLRTCTMILRFRSYIAERQTKNMRNKVAVSNCTGSDAGNDLDIRIFFSDYIRHPCTYVLTDCRI